MRRLFILFLATFPVAIAAAGQNKLAQTKPSVQRADTAAHSEPSALLPIKRVVLYKNGVGYFEHQSHIRGTQDLNIDFTSAQLNDVLKSLTAVDLGDGRISSIRYNSIAPLDQRLRSLRLPFGEDVTRSDYLTALRGARVEVHNGAVTVSGRLLSVETEKRFNDKGESYEVTQFSMITDGGEMRNFDLGSGTSVKLADRDLSDEVGKYLNLIGSSRARDVRRMTISDIGTGERDVFVSYISEVPVWKSTYRIILPEKPGEKPLLQGWAIVDNTVGEDWKDIDLSLIAGAPQSFIQDISRPVYTRRPVVPLPEAALLTPQTQEASMSSIPPPPPPPPSEGVTVTSASPMVDTAQDGQGTHGAIGGVLQKSMRPGSNGRNFDRLQSFSSAAAQQQAEAEGKDLGDYFEYNLKQKITIGKNQSALVPILQSRIEAEKVTIWNENTRDTRRALWITNSSGLTLDSGTFNIVDQNTFAGEGLIDEVHPAERRLISYAGDSALRVTMVQQSSEKPYTRIQIAKGTMIVTREQRDSRTYTLHNADNAPRDVVIEHPARENWKLAEGTKPDETSASYLRFRVAVPASQTQSLRIEEYQPLDSKYQLSNLDDNTVALISQQRQITPAMQDAFRRVLDQKNKVDEIGVQIKTRQREIESITRDQARVRENMKGLKGTAEEKALVQRYVRQLDSQEDSLNSLNKESADLQIKKNEAARQLDQIVQEISFDQTF